MDLRIEGNAALTTASSSGLGNASAKALAAEGANVVINGRDQDKLEKAIAELSKIGTGDVVGVQGDITDETTSTELVETAVDQFGGIDHVVTSAGGPPYGEFMEQDDENWYEAFDMLVMGVVRLLRQAEEHLRTGDGGTIVNITSVTVKEAMDSLVLSNSVRMSIIGLEKTLSREFAPEVRVNAILPGSFETKRFRDGMEDDVRQGVYESYDDALAERVTDIPLNRVGQPEELGDFVAYLSSDRASYLNGVAIPVDGGVTESNL
jgi:3-oxoacyl-[acyl-carrier protein] reductase